MSGYSGTPLGQKLGIKEGYEIYVHNPPVDYRTLVDPIPEGVVLHPEIADNLDMIHFFTSHQGELRSAIERLKEAIKPAGSIWISWPKKSSGVESDVSEDVIRQIVLPLDLVDIKVCAVDEIWSGLKVVIRRNKRK